MLFKTKDLLGIEIGTEFIKLAHLKPTRSGGQLVAFASTDIRALTDEQIIEFITKFITENKVKTNYVVNVVPARFAITKNIELPSTDQAEIKQIIQLQAGRHSPYSREEIVIDYIPIGVFKGGYTRVLLTIVNRDYLKRNMDIIERAGLAIKKVVLGFETMAGWFAERSAKPLGLLHLDTDAMDFTVFTRGKPIFVRTIPLGTAQLLYDPDKYAPKFQEEIRQSLETYQSEHLENLQQLLVSGLTDKADVINLLKEISGLEINTVSQFEGIGFSTSLIAAHGETVTSNVSFLPAITAALKYDKILIDLTPEEVKVREAMAEKSRDVIWMGTLLILVMVLVSAIFAQKIWMRNALLTELKKNYDAGHDLAVELRKKHQQTRTAVNFLKTRSHSLEVLMELQKLVPNEIYLSAIIYERDKQQMLLRGIANMRADALNLRDLLEKSPHFKDVELRNTSAATRKGKQVTEFEIVCKFEATMK